MCLCDDQGRYTHILKREKRQERKDKQSRGERRFPGTSGEWDVMRNSSPDTIDDDDEVNVSFPALLIPRSCMGRGKLLTGVWLGCQR